MNNSVVKKFIVFTVCGVLVGLYLIKCREDVLEFEDRTKIGLFFGNSVAQIESTLGRPQAMAELSPGNVDLIYFGPHQRVCRIEVRSGRAVRSVYWTS